MFKKIIELKTQLFEKLKIETKAEIAIWIGLGSTAWIGLLSWIGMNFLAAYWIFGAIIPFAMGVLFIIVSIRDTDFRINGWIWALSFICTFASGITLAVQGIYFWATLLPFIWAAEFILLEGAEI